MKKLMPLLILIAFIVALLVGGSKFAASQPSKLDAFAQCLTEKKATFYGAFWCPHCQNTKAMFGNAKKYLTYVECSTPDGQGQTEACKTNDIKNYPTWIFADGTRQTGEVALTALASTTGCVLPQ